jgi:hypothetical protein
MIGVAESRGNFGRGWERRKEAIKESVPSRAGVIILDVEPSESTRPNIRFVPRELPTYSGDVASP